MTHSFPRRRSSDLEIIVEGVVLARPRPAVSTEVVNAAVDEAPPALGSRDGAQAPSIAHEEIEERNRIEARPFAERPGLVPAHRSRRHQPDTRAPAVQAHEPHRSRLGPARAALAAVRSTGIDPSFEEPLTDAAN